MASIGNPIANDDKYGDFKANKEFYTKFKYKYQLLHSYKIKFNNVTGVLSYLNNQEFIAPIKKEEKTIIETIFPSFDLSSL